MNDGGPAFPSEQSHQAGTWNQTLERGMSLRDYFAAKAMQAMVGSDRYVGWSTAQITQDAYRYADAMLKERS